MRRLALAVLAAAMVVGTALPAAAHPTAGQAPTLPTDLTHAKTNNIEYLGRFPEHTGTAGGQLTQDGRTFLITDPRGVYAYDVTNPASPVLLDSVAVYQTGESAALAQEDPDTDGRLLLVDGAPSLQSTANFLHVIDVSNPRDLKIASSLNGASDHTWECVSQTDVVTGEVNGCAYAYGRSGAIIDLRNPATPKRVSGLWRQKVGMPASNSGESYTHDLNEIRPGLVMSAGANPVLMDTTNPASPIKLTQILQPKRFTGLGYHSVEWNNGGTDPIITMGTEITPGPVATGGAGAGSDCKGTESVIETWDATQILEGLAAYNNPELGLTAEEAFAGKAFTKIDEFDAAGRGIFLTGNQPANVLYCAHWFEPNPNFNGQGIVAVAYYDRGTRFVNVGADGQMTEVGWMVPAEGYAGSVQWVTENIAYVMDYRRGLEILKFNTTPATGVEQEAPTAIAVGSSYVPPSAFSTEELANVALGFFGVVIGASKLRSRMRRQRG